MRSAIRVCVCLLMLAVVTGCSKSAKAPKVDYIGERKTTLTSETGEKDVLAGCPPGMILIPGGPMLYGPTEEKNAPLDPKATAERLTMKAFCIDRFEFPNQQGEPPVRSVSWLEAKNLCGQNGKRLCSEYEFEKACRGPAGTHYTYGDGFADKICPNASEEYGLGQFSNCVSGFGVEGMSGGVYEWTSSNASSSASDEGTTKILRGGLTAENAQRSGRCSFRTRFTAANTSREVGFRCCAVPVAEKPGADIPTK